MNERRKGKCKECKGSAICEHGNVKYTCKECVRNGICEHGNVEYFCIPCSGAGIVAMGNKNRFARIVVVMRCAKPHIVLRKKFPSMMDTVGFALSICVSG